jgi:hypothetical protein
VLALETRLVQARDIDSGDFLQVEVILKTESGQEEKVMTPAVLREDVVQLRVESECFYALSMEVSTGRIVTSQTQSNLEQILFIKKRTVQ